MKRKSKVKKLKELREELKTCETELNNLLSRRDGIFNKTLGRVQIPVSKEIEIFENDLKQLELERDHCKSITPQREYETLDEWYECIKFKYSIDIERVKKTLEMLREQKERIEKRVPEVEKRISELKKEIESLQGTIGTVTAKKDYIR